MAARPTYLLTTTLSLPQAVASSSRCDRFSGADLAGLAREAAVAALREYLINRGEKSLGVTTDPQAVVVAPLAADVTAAASAIKSTACPAPVHQRHFLDALARTAPSVSLADERMYSALRGRMEQARSRLVVAAEPGSDPSPTGATAAGSEGRLVAS